MTEPLKKGQLVASVAKWDGYYDESNGFYVGVVTSVSDLLYEEDLKYIQLELPNGELGYKYSNELLTFEEVQERAEEMPLTWDAIQTLKGLKNWKDKFMKME